MTVGGRVGLQISGIAAVHLTSSCLNEVPFSSLCLCRPCIYDMSWSPSPHRHAHWGPALHRSGRSAGLGRFHAPCISVRAVGYSRITVILNLLLHHRFLNLSEFFTSSQRLDMANRHSFQAPKLETKSMAVLFRLSIMCCVQRQIHCGDQEGVPYVTAISKSVWLTTTTFDVTFVLFLLELQLFTSRHGGNIWRSRRCAV